MTDRELLELAAKAAGIATYDYGSEVFTDNWNPLTDDGDALRLAVKLGMNIYSGAYIVVAEVLNDHDDPPITSKVFMENDKLAATRRAIVRAAAKIGKRM